MSEKRPKKETAESKETRADAQIEDPDAAADAENKDEEAENPGAEAADDETASSEPAEESADIKYLRLAADFQNYKKRTEKERFERYSEGKKDFAADLLPVLDNFERAIAQDVLDVKTRGGSREAADEKFLEGMQMILTQLQAVLAKAGIEEIAAEGAEFDPNVHNAVMVEQTDAYESGKVSEVLQKGYKLGEKIIRPAMVKVAQ